MTEDDGFITIYPPIYAHEPELTATPIMLQEWITHAARAHIENVLSGLVQFMQDNPGHTPVLRTWYDETTKTLHTEWISTHNSGDPT